MRRKYDVSIYRRNCENCGVYYIGHGIKFCSYRCSVKFLHKTLYNQEGQKLCTKCEKFKILKDFDFRGGTREHQLNSHCRECKAEAHSTWNRSAEGIWRILRSRRKVLINKKLFVDWYTKQEKKCVYCDITEKDWVDFYGSDHIKSAKRLTIDRIDNNIGYILENIALSCYRCNFVKNEIFTPEEMLKIAQEYIKPKWKQYKEEMQNAAYNLRRV